MLVPTSRYLIQVTNLSNLSAKLRTCENEALLNVRLESLTYSLRSREDAIYNHNQIVNEQPYLR